MIFIVTLAVAGAITASALATSSAGGDSLGTRVAFRDFLSSPKGGPAMVGAGLPGVEYRQQAVAAARRGNFHPCVRKGSRAWCLTVFKRRNIVFGTAVMVQRTVNPDNSQDAVFEREDRILETSLYLDATRRNGQYTLRARYRENAAVGTKVVRMEVHADACTSPGTCMGGCAASQSVPCLPPLPATPQPSGTVQSRNPV